MVRPLAGPVGARRPGSAFTREAAHRMLRLLHTADVHLGARHADLGDAAARPARAPVRRLQGERGPRDRGEGRPVPRGRRPVRLQRPAPPLRGARGRGARPPRARRGSAPSSSRAPTTSTTARRSTAPTTSPRWRARARQDDLVTVLTPDHPWIHLQALDASSTGRCFPTKRAPYSPLRDLAALEVPARRPGRSASSTPRSRSRAGRTTTRSW